MDRNKRCPGIKVDPDTELCVNCGVPAYRVNHRWIHEWRLLDRPTPALTVRTKVRPH